MVRIISQPRAIDQPREFSIFHLASTAPHNLHGYAIFALFPMYNTPGNDFELSRGTQRLYPCFNFRRHAMT